MMGTCGGRTLGWPLMVPITRCPHPCVIHDPWVVGRTCDVLSTNRLQTRWWDASPVICLHKSVTSQVTYESLLYSSGNLTQCSVLCWAVLSSQSCLALCNPMDCSLLGSSVHGIFQARILEKVAMPSSRGSSQPRGQSGSPALQADSLPSDPPGKPMNTGVGSLSLTPGDLSNPGIKLGSPALEADSLPAELAGKPSQCTTVT